MAETQKKALPDCGLFRTNQPMPGRESTIPAGRLIYFHNHSEQGQPLILLPEKNANNRWTFAERGYLVRDPFYIVTLTPLPAEGLYVLRSHLHSGKTTIPERSLVQLGYNQAAEPILFLGRWEGNSIEFPDKGLKPGSDAIFKELDPVGFTVRGQPGTKSSLH